MSRTLRLAVGAATALLATSGALVLGASPAAADHVVDVGAEGCYAGPIGSRTGLSLLTGSSTSTVLPDGSTRYVCVFTGLPGSTTAEENGYVDWARPARPLRVTLTCATSATEEFTGQGLFTPSGMLRVVCVEPPR